MYKFDPKTGVLILQGKWTAGMFRKLIDQLGITNITQIIVDDYAYLSVNHMDLTNITVARTGYFTCAYCNINGIDSKGVVRARYSILTEVSNDGQLYLTCRTHARGIKCFRHLNLSQCFVSDLHCFTHASVKATSSYIAASDATPVLFCVSEVPLLLTALACSVIGPDRLLAAKDLETSHPTCSFSSWSSKFSAKSIISIRLTPTPIRDSNISSSRSRSISTTMLLLFGISLANLVEESNSRRTSNVARRWFRSIPQRPKTILSSTLARSRSNKMHPPLFRMSTFTFPKG